MPRDLLADTGRRTLKLHNLNTTERLTVEYWVDGWYDPDALAALDRFLRDWRTGEVKEIDPNLLDLVYLLHRRCAPGGEVQVVCGYRSPKTNAMLRRQSSGVARNSYHLRGQAMDFRIEGADLHGVRQEAVAAKVGGVGYYPRSDFVHVDTGPVRTW
ncbi:MAG: DUF882 domain-containing protein [Azospirillaceae bacterium]